MAAAGSHANASVGVQAERADHLRGAVVVAEAVEQGALEVYLHRTGVPGLATVDGDPLFLPLRRDPRFQALARPDPADVP